MNSDSGSLILMYCMDMERKYWPLLLMMAGAENTMVFYLSIATDRHSHRVFLPVQTGVLVARLAGDKLFKERVLQCVDIVDDLAVIPLDTLYVCDWVGRAVHIIDGIHDTVTGRLNTPALTKPNLRPGSVAVQGDNVVVGYCRHMGTVLQIESGIQAFSLVVYRHGSLTPIRILHAPDIDVAPRLTADSEGHVLLVHCKTATVHVINMNENVYRVNPKIKFNTDSQICGCSVVNRQLWVACDNSDIIIMSSGKSQKDSLLNKI